MTDLAWLAWPLGLLGLLCALALYGYIRKQPAGNEIMQGIAAQIETGAMAFLRREGKYADAPRPDVILLDLNLPKKDGREVLAEVKADPSLRLIPVVIITSSEAEQDVLKTYELYANCYVTKPVDLEQFIKVIQSIETFWLTIVTLPSSVTSD